MRLKFIDDRTTDSIMKFTHYQPFLLKSKFCFNQIDEQTFPAVIVEQDVESAQSGEVLPEPESDIPQTISLCIGRRTFEIKVGGWMDRMLNRISEMNIALSQTRVCGETEEVSASMGKGVQRWSIGWRRKRKGNQ